MAETLTPSRAPTHAKVKTEILRAVENALDDDTRAGTLAESLLVSNMALYLEEVRNGKNADGRLAKRRFRRRMKRWSEPLGAGHIVKRSA